MKINLIELYYVKIPLESKKPGFFSQPAYFNPRWIPGFRQSEMRFYLLKLGTDLGLKQSMYLKGKKAEQSERTERAEFDVPEPPF